MSTESKQRDKLDYIQFDHDFLSKHKTQALHLKFGNDGLLAIMGAIFLMGNATDGEIEIDAFIANARIYGCDADKCNDIINYCLHPDRKLFLSGSKPGWITNSRVTEDQERVYLKREKWRASQKKRRHPEGVSSDVMQDTHETLNTEHMNTEDLKILDPKEGGSGETIDLGHGIKLDPMAMDALKLEFARFGLKPLWIGRAAAYCATQNNEKYKNGPYLYLSTWGIQRCLEEKDKIERVKNTENIGKKYDPGPKRPATMSPAKPDFTGPLNTIEKNLLEIVMPKAKVLTSS